MVYNVGFNQFRLQFNCKNYGNDLFVCQGDTLTLTASGADNYTWSNGITNNVTFTPDSTAYYNVSGTDNKNCTGLDSLLVTIQALPVMILDTVIDQGCEGVFFVEPSRNRPAASDFPAFEGDAPRCRTTSLRWTSFPALKKK